VAESLDAERIAAGISPSYRPRLRHVTVLNEVDSTNLELARFPAAEQHAHAILAERQTAGKGRRERRWHSPAGGNVYLSFGWRFPHGEHLFSTLPLIVAIAAADALRSIGLEGHGIKWPNDILAGGRKLAGILAELKSGGSSGTTAIIGIGINVRMPVSDSEDPARLIDRPWTDVETHLDEARKPCDRNTLAAALLDRLIGSLDRFEHFGFEPFSGEWKNYDLLQDNLVTLELESGDVAGTALGVNDSGELLLQTQEGQTQAFNAGEVRVYRGIRTF
jgi:BirA family biotin operon repressor/biotin-[acetyl-CoA-carboxylase] ligase